MVTNGDGGFTNKLFHETILYSTLLYSTIRQAAKAIGCVRGTILLADKAFKQRKSSI
jgi:hypothetical protein